MKKRFWNMRRLEEGFFKILMILSLGVFIGCMGLILLTIVQKGLPYLNLAMITETPKGGYYLGKEGGVLNAMLGSLYLAGGATFLAVLMGLPLVLLLHMYARHCAWAQWVRLTLDLLWGIPSIVYGAFGFILMLALGLRASLLAGIITLSILELPIFIRAMDEIIQLIPVDLEQASFSLGATRFETVSRVILRQVAPSLITAVQLALGRGVGDAAAVMFTTGYTDRLPTSLFQPTASLPMAVFYQLNTPYPEVQGRAYASALILLLFVLFLSMVARLIAGRSSQFIIK